MIAAVDKNWGIGNKGKLLVSIPEDMKFFRQTTTGHVVVMGRNTLQSFPGGLPLKNRINIVLTTDHRFSAKDAVIVHDLEELKEAVSAYDTDEVYVIGGGSVYRQLAGLCDRAYITYIDYSYEADTRFPNLDESEDWELVRESEEQTYFDLEYYFREYRRKKS